MMNLNQIRVFFHVAKNLSYTLAARDLFITQPGVTNHLRALEDQWKLNLFGKRGKRIYLTEEGKALYEYAQKIFKCEKEMELAVEQIQNLKRGILRIGMPKTFMQFFMSRVMDKYRIEYPDVRIQVNEGNSTEIIKGILDRRNEIAFIAKIEENPDIQFIHLSRQKLVLVVAPAHRLAVEQVVTPQELAREPIVLREAGSGMRKVVTEFFRHHDNTPKILIETSNNEYTKGVVQRGDGVALLTEGSVSYEVSHGDLVVVPIKGAEIFLDMYVAYSKNIPLSLPARAYLKLFAKTAPHSPQSYDMIEGWTEKCPYLV